MQEGADLNIAFDPKWSDVVISTRFSGTTGETLTCNDKTRQRFTATGCSIAEHPQFPGGALYFDAAPANRYVWSTSAALSLGEHLFEIDFLATSLGATGYRGLFKHPSDMLMARIDPVASAIEFGVRSSASAAWSMVSYTIPDLDEFLGVRHTLRCVMTVTALIMELDGQVVATAAHGLTSFSASANSLLIGTVADVNNNAGRWIGYLGQIRWTRALRPDEMGQPMPVPWPIGASADPQRAAVVFHSRFDGPNLSQAAVDIKGKSIVFVGAARLESTLAWAGRSSFRANGGYALIDHPDLVLGADDFTFEFFVARTGNSGQREYLFSLMDADGLDHAVSLSASGFGGYLYLRVAGIDVATIAAAGPENVTFYWYSVVRQGSNLAVFRNNIRVALVNVGDGPIASNGQLVFGKGGAAAPGNQSLYDYVDEARFTRGYSRVSPLLTSTTPPADMFPAFGPRAISGHVDDADGNPVDCVVRVHRSLTGQMVSQGRTAADGSFVLPVADIDEHYWTAHLPGKNALIFDHVVPELVT